MSDAGEHDVEQVLDAMLDQATAAHPGVEWSITVAEEQAARIPVHSTKLWREVNGRMGYYAGHVYRDCLVDAMPLKPWLLYLAAADDATEDTYYGDLRTGIVSAAPPSDAFFH